MFLVWLLIGIDVIIGILTLILFTLSATLGGSILLLGLIILNVCVFGLPPFYWILENPTITIEYIVGYLIIGFIWSVLNWKFFYITSKKVKDKIESSLFLWTRIKDTPEFKDSKYYPFKFENDSGMIAYWVLLWPFNIISVLFENYIVNFWKNLWNLLLGIGKYFTSLYAAIANNHVDKIVSEYNNKKQNQNND